MEIVIDNGINYAYCEPSSKIHPSLTEHSKTFQQRIYKCAERFYLAVGYGIANVTIVEGDDGLIIIDTSESKHVAEEIMCDFWKLCPEKPVVCVIYTHNHYDHIGGVKGLVKKEDVDSGKVDIIANERICCGIRNTASIMGNVINIRAAYSFGLLLDKGEDGSVNEGIGSKLRIGESTYIAPTIVFDKYLAKTVSGIRMELFYGPSETDDELYVWFPDYDVLQSADVIMGQCFPNIYTIRGTPNRDAVKWYMTIDKMRTHMARYLLPSHGIPMEGRQNIDEMLTAYRDAIQWVHDQTVRYTNKGLKPDELVQKLDQLPKHLGEHPWLGEFYGTVKHCVRQIYSGYLGWFEGDPTFLDPLPTIERSKRYCKAMGGTTAVYEMSYDAYKDGDYKWSAELCTHIINANPNFSAARCLKAESLRRLGQANKNINWRNWYITSALELEEKIDYDYLMAMQGVDSDDILSEIPLECFLRGFCVKLRYEDTVDLRLEFGFFITTGDKIVETYALEIRRCVVQFHKPAPPSVHIGVITDKTTCRNLLLRDATCRDRLTMYKDTSMQDVDRFFGYFEASKYPIRLTGPPSIRFVA